MTSKFIGSAILLIIAAGCTLFPISSVDTPPAKKPSPRIIQTVPPTPIKEPGETVVIGPLKKTETIKIDNPSIQLPQ